MVSGLNWAIKFTALAVPPFPSGEDGKQRLMHLISVVGFMDEQPVLTLQLYSIGEGWYVCLFMGGPCAGVGFSYVRGIRPPGC